MVGRIPILNVMPVVDLGRQAAKATVGEPVPVSATVFREGHDKLGAEVVATDPRGVRRDPVPLAKHPERPDHYEAWITPDVEGAWTFEVQAWSDVIGTWQHAAGLKIPAGVDVDLMFLEGRQLLRAGQGHRHRGPRQGGPGGRDRRGPGHRAPGRGPPRRAPVPRADPRCWRRTPSASWSRSRAPTRCTPTAGSRCSAPGTSSSRAPRAPTSTRRPARSSAATSGPR